MKLQNLLSNTYKINFKFGIQLKVDFTWDNNVTYIEAQQGYHV